LFPHDNIKAVASTCHCDESGSYIASACFRHGCAVEPRPSGRPRLFVEAGHHNVLELEPFRAVEGTHSHDGLVDTNVLGQVGATEASRLESRSKLACPNGSLWRTRPNCSSATRLAFNSSKRAAVIPLGFFSCGRRPQSFVCFTRGLTTHFPSVSALRRSKELETHKIKAGGWLLKDCSPTGTPLGAQAGLRAS